MSQSDLINKPELSNTTKENHLIEILREIQATPKEYWPNLLQIMRVFRESVTFKPEIFNHSQLEIDAQQQILNQQHQLRFQAIEQHRVRLLVVNFASLLSVGQRHRGPMH